MNSEIVESVQHAVTPGECQDMYYPGKGNSELQCFPSTVENRFYAGLPALSGGGTSTIIFNPDQGLSDIVLTASLPPQAGSLYTNWALPRGWLYSCIDTIALRIGGSSLYYFASDQLLVDILTDCEDSGKKNDVLALGGAECKDLPAFQVASNLTAYAYIKLPFNSISALQKPLPLPTDLLTQPVQILITWKQFSQVFFNANSGVASDLPTAFSSASVNFRQTHLNDAGHLLARRVDMNSMALTYPLRYFAQTVFRTNVTVAGVTAADLTTQINLTGFRSGSLKYIDLWAILASDLNGGNPFNWKPLTDLQLSVNGLIYSQTNANNNQLWSMCDRRTSATVENTVVGVGSPAVYTGANSPWTVVSLGQVDQPQAFESELALGLNIQNSVVNLRVTLPAAGTYVLSAAYHYAASLLFSKGSCDYVF